MKAKNQSHGSGILPVPRTKKQAGRFYDRISKAYAYFAELFERKYAEMAVQRLSVSDGETVLEIGFGTGRCLMRIAESIGPKGKAYGIDISTGMIEISKKKLQKARLENRVRLLCGDGANLPFDDCVFDAVFMSFTLELFDTPEIPKVVEETKRVLRPGGRIGAVSVSKQNGQSVLVRLYEWAHRKWPTYVDCRPIYLEQSVRNGGYEISTREKVNLFGLPGEIVVGLKGIHARNVRTHMR